MKNFLSVRFRSFSNATHERRRSRSPTHSQVTTSGTTETSSKKPGTKDLESIIDSLSSCPCSTPTIGSLSSSSQDADLASSGDGHIESMRRHRVVVELLSSEANYTESLRKMISYYKEPLTGVLSELEISSIFSIADLLAAFHATLLQGLQQCLESWTPQILVGCFLVEKLSFLRCYSAYINNYHLAINTLAACEQHAPFRSRMQELCAAETEDGRHLQSLYSYLIMPIQRIPRYLLLLKDLQRHTAPDHSDTPHLEKAVTAIGEIAAYIENKRSLYEGCQRMAAIAGSIRRLPEGQTVLKPGRTLVREGVLFCK